MSWNGRKQVGTCGADNLIAGNRHPVDVCTVVIKEGQKLERGTLLEQDGETGKDVIRGTVEEAEAAYVLADPVDASGGDSVGAAYRSGEFAENALIVKEGYAIKEKDRDALRKNGIFLDKIMM